MRKLATFALVLAASAAAGCSGNQIDPNVDPAAIQAAQEWLKLVDAGKFGESWDQAAEYFKGTVKRERWVEHLEGLRPPLGEVVSRTISVQRNSESLPAAPDGHYVILQYKTTFENKRSATETITPKRVAEGEWRVCGYYIR
jgi:hypothetical protein